MHLLVDKLLDDKVKKMGNHLILMMDLQFYNLVKMKEYQVYMVHLLVFLLVLSLVFLVGGEDGELVGVNVANVGENEGVPGVYGASLGFFCWICLLVLVLVLMKDFLLVLMLVFLWDFGLVCKLVLMLVMMYEKLENKMALQVYMEHLLVFWLENLSVLQLVVLMENLWDIHLVMLLVFCDGPFVGSFVGFYSWCY